MDFDNPIPARTRRAASLLACAALAAAPLGAQAINLLSASYDNNTGGNGFDTTASNLYVVTPSASFSGNSFDGLFDGTASLLVLGGRFEGNVNVGAQVIVPTSKFVIVKAGSFDNNVSSASGGVGMDVYGARLTIDGGSFSGNSAYGLSPHSTTRVNGGSFTGNGAYGIAAFGGVTSVYGGSFGDNGGADFAAISGSTIDIYGSFDEYGSFSGSGSFTGTLAGGTAAQTFSYATFSGGSIVLVNAALASAVPEAPSSLLLAAGLLAMGIRRAPFGRREAGRAVAS